MLPTSNTLMHITYSVPKAQNSAASVFTFTMLTHRVITSDQKNHHTHYHLLPTVNGKSIVTTRFDSVMG